MAPITIYIYTAIPSIAIIILWQIRRIDIKLPQIIFVLMSALICGTLGSLQNIPMGEEIVAAILAVMITLLFTLLGIVAHNEKHKPES